MNNGTCRRRISPEDLLQLLHLVVGILLGASIVQKGSSIRQWPSVHLGNDAGAMLFLLLWECVLVSACFRVSGGWNTHLDADASLQFELQADHVHLTGGAKLLDLSHLLAHLVNGHFDGAQVGVVLIHHRDAFLHVGETMSGCGTETH